MLLSDVYQEWLNYHSIEIESSTAYGYELQYRQIHHYFGDARLDDLTPDAIQGFIRDLLGRVSPTTARKYCQTLKLCFDFAIKKGYCTGNPIDQVATPKRQRVEIAAFEPWEINKILQQPAPDWVRDAIIIGYRTGMRLGEIFALDWADIHLDEQFIAVQRSQCRTGSQVYIKTTKTPSGVRRIDIDTHLALHFLEMQSRQQKVGPSQYVFASYKDPHKRRIPWNISTYLRDMCKNAGVPGRNFHALRHTHASILFAHGKHPKMVQERLGHADIRTTLATYSHTTPTLQKEAVEVFENL